MVPLVLGFDSQTIHGLTEFGGYANLGRVLSEARILPKPSGFYTWALHHQRSCFVLTIMHAQSLADDVLFSSPVFENHVVVLGDFVVQEVVCSFTIGVSSMYVSEGNTRSRSCDGWM